MEEKRSRNSKVAGYCGIFLLIMIIFIVAKIHFKQQALLRETIQRQKEWIAEYV
jgi:hypothetical protein